MVTVGHAEIVNLKETRERAMQLGETDWENISDKKTKQNSATARVENVLGVLEDWQGSLMEGESREMQKKREGREILKKYLYLWKDIFITYVMRPGSRKLLLLSSSGLPLIA